jgi:hypothetical protein
MFASNSPEHIVGNHVLRRLCVPRYPPLALISLTTSTIADMQTLNYLMSVCVCLLCFTSLCSFQGSFAGSQPSSLASYCSVAEFFPIIYIYLLVQVSGLEPLTSSNQIAGALSTELNPPDIKSKAQTQKSFDFYLCSFCLFRWAILDSNQGPHPYQGCALTT